MLGHVALHEFAHGVTCKHFGGRVRQLGIMWYMAMFIFFCDTAAGRLIIWQGFYNALKEHARRLYEQEASIKRLRQYVSRWCRWFQGALTGLVSSKGGTKRYWVWVIFTSQL